MNIDYTGGLAGDTDIMTYEQGTVRINNLSYVYKRNPFFVLASDHLGRTVSAVGRSPLTVKMTNLFIEITLDTGNIIQCTPDLKFLLKNMQYVESKLLKPGDYLHVSDSTIDRIYVNSSKVIVSDNPVLFWNFFVSLYDNYALSPGCIVQSIML